MAIERLNQGTPTRSSQIPFNDPDNGADRRASVTELAALLQTLLTAGGGAVTQYAAPSATGFTVTIAPPTAGASVYLLLTPSAGYAAGTIALPARDAAIDGQEVQCSTTQAVTTLTLTSADASIIGGPTTLAANAFFRLRFDGVFRNWYRVG